MTTRATRITYGDLTSNLVISATAIIIESIIVVNTNSLQAAIIEFENSNGDIELVMLIPPKDQRIVSDRFLADYGLTVRALDSDILVTSFHSAGMV